MIPAERRRHGLCLLVGICLAALLAIGGGVASAAGPIDVTFDDESIDDETADLITIDDHDDVGIGSYEIVISHDPDMASLNATDSDRFTVVSDEREVDDGRVEKTIVGYTGKTNTTAETLTLADISVTAQNSGESELRIESVESLTDTEGSELAATEQNVTIELEEDDSDDDGGGGGGGGGVPSPDPIEDDDDEPAEDETDEPTAEDETDEPTAEDEADEPAAEDDDSDEMDDDTAVGADDDADDVAEEIPLPPIVPLTALAALLGYGMYRSRGGEP